MSSGSLIDHGLDRFDLGKLKRAVPLLDEVGVTGEDGRCQHSGSDDGDNPVPHFVNVDQRASTKAVRTLVPVRGFWRFSAIAFGPNLCHHQLPNNIDPIYGGTAIRQLFKSIAWNFCVNDREPLDILHRDLRSLWRGQLPPDQIAIWSAMSATDRAKALSRLSAVVAYAEAGSRDVPLHSKMAGVGEQRFYKMMRAWKENPSLLALVPQAAGRKARSFTPPAGIEEAAAEAVRAEHQRATRAAEENLETPRQSQEMIASALHERFGAPSISWIRRLVARARRDLDRELAGGLQGFGRRIVIDSAALSLPLLPELSGQQADPDNPDDQRIDWAVAAFVWDEATGFIVGHALGRAPAGIRLHMAAAEAASEFLRNIDVKRGDDVSTEIASTLPIEERSVMDTMRLIAKMETAGVSAIHSPRAHGSELMKAFAGRLASLELHPRFAADSFTGRTSRQDALERADRVPMTIEAARLVLEIEVAKYNADNQAAAAVPAVSPALIARGLDDLVAAVGAR